MGRNDETGRMRHQAESRRAATAKNDAVFAAMDRRASENFFANRGFSAATIETLVASGMGLPEELLLMTDDRTQSIPGLSKAGLAEVQKYRARFLPNRG